MGWNKTTLLELADGKKENFDDGDWIESPHITSSGNRLLQTGNIGVGVLLDRGTKRYISDESFSALRCKEVRPGDILICRLAEPAGRACLVEDIGELRMLTSVDVAIFRPRPQKANREFLVELLSTPGWFEKVEVRTGGSTRTRIARSELGKIELELPSVAEQSRIATIISDVNNLIDSLQRLIAKKLVIKQGIAQELLTGRTRLPGFDGTWRTQKIGDFAVVKAGGTPSTSVPSFWGGEIRWMSSGEIHKKRVQEVEGRITEEGLRKSSAQLLPTGTVLIALAGQGKTRGTVAISEVDLTTNQSIAGVLPSKDHDSYYLYCNLDQRYGELRGESTGDGGRGGLNLTIIRALEVPMPEMEEQKAIARILQDADTEIGTLERRLESARNIKQGMMQEILTGRTRLPVAEVTS